MYGSDNVKHIEDCVIPNLKNMSKNYKIRFLTLNYEKTGVNIKSGVRYGVEVVDVANDNFMQRGFADNHNYLFNCLEKTDNFILMNPDCIPLENSIDLLLELKSKNVAIVEGCQWPYEHPKDYNTRTFETAWASGAFQLIDSKFYEKIGGMDPIYFLYNEDVDLSWQAWLNGYRVLYNPNAKIIHFTNGYYEREDVISNERYYLYRNYIVLMTKFFGKDAEKKALYEVKESVSKELYEVIINDYEKIRPLISDKYVGKFHKYVKVYGLGLYAKHRW